MPPGTWLLGRVILLLVLGWAGMGVLQATLTLAVPDAANDPGLIGVIQLFGLLPALALAPRVLPSTPKRRRPVPASALATAFAGGVCLQFVLVGLTAALGDLVPALAPSEATMARLEEAMAIDDYGRAFVVPFAVVLVAPMTEELLFRGAILPALEERYGWIAALVLSALLFGGFHLAPFALVYATIAGLVLGALRLRTGSVMPAFALHAGFNAAPILISERLVPIPGFNTGDDAARLPAMVLLSAAFASVAALFSFVLFTEPARRDGPRARVARDGPISPA